MEFSDSTTLAGVRRTADGYLAGSVKAARSGTQVYSRSELGLMGGGTVVMYRPPEAVFAEDSMKTYAGKPITLGHPKDGVSADNWKELAIGTVGSKVMRDGESVVVDFSIMDAASIAAIEGGTREISMGYSTPIEMKDGVAPDGTAYQAVQTGPIRINHMAVVAKARGGSALRIGDEANTWGASPITTGPAPQPHKETFMSTKVVVLGDSAVTVELAEANIIETFKAGLLKKLSDADTALAAKDEEIGGLKAQVKTLTDAAMTPEKLAAAVADRVALEQTAKLIDASIDCAGVSDAELRKKAVTAKLGGEVVKDASDAEISGMFKALSRATVNDTVRDVLRTATVTDSANGGWGDKVAAAAGIKFKKGA